MIGCQSTTLQMALATEDDLYGDIELAGKDAEIEQLRNKLEQEQINSRKLAAEVTQLKEQLNTLLQDRTQLEINMVSLYNTAKTELKRKDTELASLRESKKNPGGNVYT